MKQDLVAAISKVPAVTLGFWIIKILATTLGETGGDSVTMTLDWSKILGTGGDAASMTLQWGYLIGTGMFLSILIILVWLQIRAKVFHPLLYWATIIASTTAGTTMADFATRSIGIGYTGGSTLLLGCVLASLFVWHRAMGSISRSEEHTLNSSHVSQSRMPSSA